MKTPQAFVRVMTLSLAAAGLAFGQTWTKIDAGVPRAPEGVTAVIVDPSSPSTVYAVGYGDGRLFKSTDGGGQWSQVEGAPSMIALAASPGDPSILYAAAGGVLTSLDGGRSWARAGSNLLVSSLAVDPRNPSIVYAAGDGGLYKSTDGGASFVLKNAGLPFLPIGQASFAISAGDPSTIYATVDRNGLYKSIDGGESWRALTGINGTFCNCSVAIDPVSPSTIYAGLLTSGGFWDVMKSTDGGGTWGAVLTDIKWGINSLLVDPASTVYASYLDGDGTGGVVKSADRGKTWSKVNTGIAPNTPLTSLALNPANPSTIFAGYFDRTGGRGGVLKTLDGGAKWNEASTGLTVLDVHAVAVDPVNPAIVYAAAGDGISKSVDGGANWSTVHFPLPEPFPGTAFVPSVVIDPHNPNVLYASVLGTGGCSYTDLFLRKSTDGGATWSDLSPTYCASGPTVSLALDPSDSNTLYAAPQDDADSGAYLYGTSDNGADWKGSYISGSFVGALAIEPGNPRSLYAGITGYSSGGVLKSSDNGKTWVSTGLTSAGVNVLTLDPRRASILYAGTSMGLFKTTDAGATWSAIDMGPAAGSAITALVIDPRRSVLYLGTSTAGVFRSLDSGKRWTPMNAGLPGTDIRALAVSSDGSGTIYAGTSGGVFTTVDQQTVEPRGRRDRSLP